MMSLGLTLVINLFNLMLEYWCYPKLSILFLIVGKSIFITQISTHWYTVLFNPGIPSKKMYISDKVLDFVLRYSEDNQSVLNNYRICKKCNILVKIDDEIVHCDECGVCIMGI